jgi:hypothetical protein
MPPVGEGTASAPGIAEVAGVAPPAPRARRWGVAILALVVAVLAVLGGRLAWRVRHEARERTRLRTWIRADIAAREAAIPRFDPVPPSQDAATTYSAAFVAVDRQALARLMYGLAKGTYLSSTGEKRRASRAPGGNRSPTAAKDLEANEKALELFEKAAAFPVNSLRDPRRWRWGEMAGLFAARADARQVDGDPDGALRDCLQAHRAARQWRRPWPMRSTPDAWHARAVDVLARVAEDRRLGAAAAREGLAALLTPEECRRISSDRYALAGIDGARSLLEFVGEVPRSATGWGRFSPPPSVFERLFERLRGGYYGEFERPQTSADVSRALEAKRRFEGIYAMKGADRTAAASEFHKSMTELPEGDIARDVAWNEVFQLTEAIEFEAFLGLVRTALAVRVREAESGAPPATLEELVPGVLDALPEDPYRGLPFRYEVKPDGWSVSTGGPPAGWPTRNFPTLIDSVPVAAPVEGK